MVPEEIDLRLLIISGTSLLFLIMASIVLFILTYQKQSIKRESRLRAMESKRQKDVLRVQIITIENERARLAKELHDGIGASLSSISLFLHSIESSISKNQNPENLIQDCKMIVENTANDVKALTRNMLPIMLEEIGLEKSIETLAEQINKPGETKVTVSCQNELDLNKDVTLQLYRIVQEAVNNSLRHSRTKQIHINIYTADNKLNIFIRDFGVGYDPVKLKYGLGIKSILSRARLINAHCKIVSLKGKGTVLKISKIGINENN